MTSIAYNQYCNISYNGGSYVCSPIKGPMSTSQTPGTIENQNRGVTYAENGQPVKTANCDNGNTNALERKMYKEKVLTVAGRLEQKLVSATDASIRIAMLKTTAIGSSGFNKLNNPMAFKNIKPQDAARAINRLRRVGSAVPRKVQSKILPASTSVANVRDNRHLQKPSKNAANVKLSAFMPRHLRARIECPGNCDGGALNMDLTSANAIMCAEELSNLTSLLSINSLTTYTNDNGEEMIVFNAPPNGARMISTYPTQYGIGDGIYLMSQVDSEYAFTILNYGKEDIVYLTGDQTTSFTRKIDGIEYSFYYGDVFMYVNGDFGIMSMFMYNQGYAGGKYILRYNEIFDSDKGIECFDADNMLSITPINGEQVIGFNSPNGDMPARQYGLGKGTYVIKSVPKVCALTLLNKGFEELIYMTSVFPDQAENEVITGDIEGDTYVFHYGDVTVHVTDNFGVVSIATHDPSFTGGEHVFKYSEKCEPVILYDINTENMDTESTDPTLPDTLYDLNSNAAYTITGGNIYVTPRVGIDVSRFVRYTVSPDLPSWLQLYQGGIISGGTTLASDAFYLRQYVVTAYLADNTYKKYFVNIVLFNQTTVIDPLYY